MLKEFRVIKILSDTEIIVDYGFFDGAGVEDELRVIERGPQVIVDGKDYGTLDAIKATVEVVVPYYRFSICKKVQRSSRILSPLSALQPTTITYKSLNVDEEQIDRDLKPPSVTPIQLGDVVQKC